MQGRRIEIRSVRPDECVAVWIKTHLPEDALLAQGGEQVAAQDRKEINDPGCAVVEPYTQREIGYNFKSSDFGDEMVGHG